MMELFIIISIRKSQNFENDILIMSEDLKSPSILKEINNKILPIKTVCSFTSPIPVYTGFILNIGVINKGRHVKLTQPWWLSGPMRHPNSTRMHMKPPV